MKLERDLHLDVSRKLQNNVNVKVFAVRAGCADMNQRVCLGTLHMPEDYFRALRKVFEYGLGVVGARVTVGGSYFGRETPTASAEPLSAR